MKNVQRSARLFVAFYYCADSIDRYLATEYAELLQLTSDIRSPLLKAVE